MVAPQTLLQNRYLVLNQIGQGGMGAVYIATDQRFGSTVALKETFFTDLSLRKAFEREARLLNHLRHPALPRVSDHFAEEEGQFLVMEFIAGDDLAEKLRERGGAFPLSEVLNWADQLLDALDYLHTQEPSVIHRDIKPQNLKLTPRNAIVLLDFGLAKGTPLQTKVTATGSVFGYSRHYAPLEQIQGAGTDPRSDIYSLGATLYHLMTGAPPPDALTRATAVLNGQDDPLRPASEVHAQITREVAEVINQAMALNANQRPQSASAMRGLLRDAARQGHSLAQEIAAQPAPSSNVYEQETQLIYAAPASTATDDAANKTGTVKADGATKTDHANETESATATGGTASDHKPATAANANATEADADASVVTKVTPAKTTPTTQKTTAPTQKMPRRRVIGIALSVAVLVALAAVVYTFTRGKSQPASKESVQSQPVASPASNANNQNGATPVETPAETEKTAATPEPTPSKVIIKHPDVPDDSANRDSTSKPAPKPEPREKRAQTNGEPETPETPETPDQDETGSRRRDRRNFPAPGTPGYDEAIRAAEERRQARQEQRRANEQAKRDLILQRMMERERRRQQRQQP